MIQRIKDITGAKYEFSEIIFMKSNIIYAEIERTNGVEKPTCEGCDNPCIMYETKMKACNKKEGEET